MPILLQGLAILFAVYYFYLTWKLVKKDKAEIHNMNKWLFLGIVLIVGAVFPDFGSSIAHLVGITTLTSLSLFILTGFLLITSLSVQITLNQQQKQQKKITQELSIKDVKIYD